MEAAVYIYICTIVYIHTHIHSSGTSLIRTNGLRGSLSWVEFRGGLRLACPCLTYHSRFRVSAEEARPRRQC